MMTQKSKIQYLFRFVLIQKGPHSPYRFIRRVEVPNIILIQIYTVIIICDQIVCYNPNQQVLALRLLWVTCPISQLPGTGNPWLKLLLDMLQHRKNYVRPSKQPACTQDPGPRAHGKTYPG